MGRPKDLFKEDTEIKYAWYQIMDLVFTAPRYLKEYLISLFGVDPDREIIWINKSSPHLYETRWRPDFCFVYIRTKDAETLDFGLRANKIGHLVLGANATYQTFSKRQIDKLVESPFIQDLIGKNVIIVHGPLEDFYARVTGYSTELKKYILTVKLLLSEVQIPHHLNEFAETDKEIDNVQAILDQVSKVEEEENNG